MEYEHGIAIDTVREVINRWAPGVENDTESYIKAVAAGVGVAPNQPIDLRNFRTLIAITTGIVRKRAIKPTELNMADALS